MAGGIGATMLIRKYDIFNVNNNNFRFCFVYWFQILTLFILHELLVEDIRVKLQQQQQVCFIFTIQFNDYLLMSSLEKLTALLCRYMIAESQADQLMALSSERKGHDAHGGAAIGMFYMKVLIKYLRMSFLGY